MDALDLRIAIAGFGIFAPLHLGAKQLFNVSDLFGRRFLGGRRSSSACQRSGAQATGVMPREHTYSSITARPWASVHRAYSPPLRASSSKYCRPSCCTPCTCIVWPSSSWKLSPAAQGPDSALTTYRVSRIVMSPPCTSWEKSFQPKSRRAAHTTTSVSLVGGSGLPNGLRPGESPLTIRVIWRSRRGV